MHTNHATLAAGALAKAVTYVKEDGATTTSTVTADEAFTLSAAGTHWVLTWCE